MLDVFMVVGDFVVVPVESVSGYVQRVKLDGGFSSRDRASGVQL